MRGPSPDPLPAGAREAALAAVRPDWLAGQRWMRAKHRRPVSVRLADLFPLDDVRIRGLPPDRDAGAPTDGVARCLAVVDVGYGDAATECYAVPLVIAGGTAREPAAGEGVWRALGAMTLTGDEVAGTAGTIRGVPLRAPADGTATPVSRLLRERPLGAEQSNTSVVLGDHHVLKLYRLLEVGANPEVEVATFLTEVGFDRTPAVRGSAIYRDADGRDCALAMTQAFVANQGDAWSWLLGRLGEPDGPTAALAAVTRIAGLTADLHAALASRPDDPRFPARPATSDERAAWRRDADGLLARAVSLLVGAERARLEAIAPAISRRLAALDDPVVGPVHASRIHGDYHLGQLLVTEAGFSVIDFEGEPARPLEARCLPASPLRDVAGMLRSLDYAARTAERDGRLDPSRAASWLARARDAFLDGYGRRSPGEAALLLALEAEKACYEVVYEATSRPTWTWLPLEALERMAS